MLAIYLTMINHALLQLLAFNTPDMRSGCRGARTHFALWEKLTEQVFRHFQEMIL